jgi:hypothetical protein
MQGDLAHATDQSVTITGPRGRVGAVRGGRAVECGDILVCLGSVHRVSRATKLDLHSLHGDRLRSLPVVRLHSRGAPRSVPADPTAQALRLHL